MLPELAWLIGVVSLEIELAEGNHLFDILLMLQYQCA